MRPGFLMGVLVGVAGIWLYHKFAGPLPGGKR